MKKRQFHRKGNTQKFNHPQYNWCQNRLPKTLPIRETFKSIHTQLISIISMYFTYTSIPQPNAGQRGVG